MQGKPEPVNFRYTSIHCTWCSGPTNSAAVRAFTYMLVVFKSKGSKDNKEHNTEGKNHITHSLTRESSDYLSQILVESLLNNLNYTAELNVLKLHNAGVTLKLKLLSALKPVKVLNLRAIRYE